MAPTLGALLKLNLNGSGVTDEGLKSLAGLKDLTTLYLSATEVSDAGMKEIAKLKNLTKCSAAISSPLQRQLEFPVGLFTPGV